MPVQTQRVGNSDGDRHAFVINVLALLGDRAPIGLSVPRGARNVDDIGASVIALFTLQG
jgi:hypothetical protein